MSSHNNVNTTVLQGNSAQGSNIQQYSNADVDVTAMANASDHGHGFLFPWYHNGHQGNATNDVQTTVVQQNQAQGNNITQMTNADVDVTTVANAQDHGGWFGWWGHGHGGNAVNNTDTTVLQNNQALGNNITQVSNADVDVTSIANAQDHGGWFGHWGHGGGNAINNVDTTLVQQNTAQGNNILQASNADVDVTAVANAQDHSGWFGWWGHGHGGNAINDVATTVVQPNQALGNGITQVTGADVDVASFVNVF